MKKISIIAPIYNEVDNIKIFYQEISKNVLKSVDYEIIFVDDGSSDKSLKVITNLVANDNKIKFFSLNKNYGQQTAIFVGLKYCLGQAAIVIDCDLQDPPELIPRMIHFWLKGYKIVLPQRLSRDDPFTKIYSAKFYYFILNLLRSNNLNPRIGEFYLLDRLAIDQIINTAKEPLFLRGKVQFLKFDKFILNYRRKRRASGKSGFSYKKMLKLAIDSLRMGKNNTQPRFEISESNFFKDKKIAIIGAGICGLASAYFLLKLGFKVEIFEKEKETGGLLSGVRIADTKVDRYYHHLFRGQTRLLKLCRELNLNCGFKQSKSSMGYLLNNKIYSFNTIFDYLKLPCLSFFQKIRMGSAIFLLKFSDSSACKQLSASNIIIAKLGFASWQSFWQTLFENKFGAYAKDISASWFIGRLNDRSKGIKQEVLIYPKNGFFQ